MQSMLRLCRRWYADTTFHQIVLVALLFAITLPAFDHHAIERDPAHGHLAVSGLVPHSHAYEVVHMDGASASGRQMDERVFVTSQASDEGGVLSVGTNLVGATHLSVLTPVLSLTELIGEVMPAYLSAALKIPPHPPRSS